MRTRISVGPRDAAFIVRPGRGRQLVLPSEAPNSYASQESMDASMLAWILSTRPVLEEMRDRFARFCLARQNLAR